MHHRADRLGVHVATEHRGIKIVLEPILRVARIADPARESGTRDRGRGGQRTSGGVDRHIGKGRPIVGRLRLEERLQRIAICRVVSTHRHLLRAGLVTITADSTEEDQPILPELGVERGEAVAVAGVVDGLGIEARVVDDPARRDGRGRARVGIVIGDGLAGEVDERTAGLVPIAADLHRRRRAVNPRERIGALRQAEPLIRERVVILVFTNHGVDREIAEARVLLPRDGGADVVVIVVTEAAEEIPIAVGLQVVGVGRAIREDAVEIEVGGAGAAVLFAVRVVRILVHVTSELHIEISELLLHRELKIAKRTFEERPVLIDRKTLGGADETRARFDQVETIGRDVHRIDQIGVRQAEGGIAAGHKARDRRRRCRATAERDRLVGVAADRVEAVVRIVDVVVGAAARDALRLQRGDLRGGSAVERGRRGKRRAPIPTRELILEIVDRLVDLAVDRLGFEPDHGITERPQRRRSKNAFALLELFLAPAEAVLRNAGDAQGDLIVDGLVHVDRRPHHTVRSRRELHILKRAVGARALRRRGTHAAEAAVAEHDGVGPAPEVVALKRVTVVVAVDREKVPQLLARTHTARVVTHGEGREVIRTDVRLKRRTRRPVLRLHQVREIERLDELAIDHRKRRWRVAQITRETAARERTRGRKASVPVTVHLERRQRHRTIGRRRGFLRRRCCGLGRRGRDRCEEDEREDFRVRTTRSWGRNGGECHGAESENASP